MWAETALSNPTIEGGGDVTNLSPSTDGDDRKATPPGGRFDQPTGGMICARGTLAYQVGGVVFSSPVGAVLMTSPPEIGDGNPLRLYRWIAELFGGK